jgi:RNA polymerase sigma-70 factor (ECF subfamily)
MSEPDPPDAPTTVPSSDNETELDTAHDAEFTVFYRATTKQLVAFLMLQGAALADATDIIQDTMTQAYRRWRNINHPRAWAYRVASRALIRRMVDNRDTLVNEPPEPSPLLRSSDIERWEQRHDITRALAELPTRQRQVVTWTLFGYTPAEIAEVLQMAPGAVRQHLHRARQALCIRLKRRNGEQ